MLERQASFLFQGQIQHAVALRHLCAGQGKLPLTAKAHQSHAHQGGQKLLQTQITALGRRLSSSEVP